MAQFVVVYTGVNVSHCIALALQSRWLNQFQQVRHFAGDCLCWILSVLWLYACGIMHYMAVPKARKLKKHVSN